MKGFIQIPIAAAIFIVVMLVVGGVNLVAGNNRSSGDVAVEPLFESLKDGEWNTVTTAEEVSSTEPAQTAVPAPKKKAEEISSANLVKIVDSLIDGYRSSISKMEYLRDSASASIKDAEKGMELMSEMLEDESDSFMRESYQYGYKVFQTDATAQNRFIADIDQNISKWRIYVTILEEEKRSFLPSYSPENFMAKYNELIKRYDDIDKTRQVVEDAYDFHIKLDDTILTAHKKWMANADDYMNAYRDAVYSAYNSWRSSPSVIYQPAVTPQFQMPKTTRCTLSGDGGVGLQAYVTCSTY